MIRHIKIRTRPTVIILTKFEKEDDFYLYYLHGLSTKNKGCDVGCWKIKYKIPDEEVRQK